MPSSSLPGARSLGCEREPEDTADLPSDDDSVELVDLPGPRKPGVQTGGDRKCCAYGCTDLSSDPIIAQTRAELHAKTRAEQDQFLLCLLSGMRALVTVSRPVVTVSHPVVTVSHPTEGKPPSEAPAQFQWQVAGRRVCARGWRALLGVGSKRVTKLQRAVVEGKPLLDGRRYNKGRPCQQSLHCHAFLEWLYQCVAEPLADTPFGATDVVEPGDEAQLQDEEPALCSPTYEHVFSYGGRSLERTTNKLGC